jgi:Gpi18-like mannosyltransferase
MKKYKKFFETHPLWFVFFASLITSVISTAYYFHHNEILAYNDARSHLDIARRVIDSKTPGATQFGGAWLPLPQLLMLPFVASHSLWQNGLAGSFVSMASYIVSSIFIFRILRLLTKNVYISTFGSLLFMLNPNVLYMQSTPMTELVLLAAVLLGSYYFVKWVHTHETSDLLLAALGTFLATLVRYEGWFLLAVRP